MDTIVGRGFWPGWARRGYFVVLLVLVVFLIALRRFDSLWNVGMWGLFGLGFVRRPTTVSRHRIVVPRIGKWTRRIEWDEVASIAPPGRGETVTTLLLTSGEDVPLEGIDASLAPDVAALGEKPIRNRPLKPWARSPRPPTEAEVERDLQRRSADLASNNAALRAELDRLRRKPQ